MDASTFARSLPKVPVHTAFRVRTHRDEASVGDKRAVLAAYDGDSHWRRLGSVPLTEPDGAYLSSVPIVLLGSDAAPGPLAVSFPGLILLAGLGTGGDGPARKPTKVGAGATDSADTPETVAKVTARVFRADDNGAFWAEAFAGNIDWDTEEQRASKEGWEDSDENPFATKEEMLGHLQVMDGDDIWIYSGHLGFRQQANPSQSDNRANYLVGYTRSDYVLISKDEIKTAMGAEPVGLVVLSGCGSWEMRETFEGVKIFGGFTDVVNDLESDATTQKFMRLLWDGRTVAEAEAAANRSFQSMWYNKGRRANFTVRCQDKTKTIYDILEVPRTPK